MHGVPLLVRELQWRGKGQLRHMFFVVAPRGGGFRGRVESVRLRGGVLLVRGVQSLKLRKSSGLSAIPSRRAFN